MTAGALSPTLRADGGGHAAVVVDSPEVARLYEQLRPVAKQIATLSLFIDPADRTVVLCGSDADLSITVQGKDIAAASAPPDALALLSYQDAQTGLILISRVSTTSVSSPDSSSATCSPRR